MTRYWLLTIRDVPADARDVVARLAATLPAPQSDEDGNVTRPLTAEQQAVVDGYHEVSRCQQPFHPVWYTHDEAGTRCLAIKSEIDPATGMGSPNVLAFMAHVGAQVVAGPLTAAQLRAATTRREGV